ncbi:polycomb group protein Psc-like isoform X2 [Zophobas morio]
MYRRKEFFQNRPALAPKVSPEERGEDTERTIFNPQDAISLSIEYISDDSAPGAIPSLATTQKGAGGEEVQDNPMKRYLECPAMCRIEVLKKFVRNKYNVDTNLFHIDILYKRVPLPDHYTLIDIGYIYSWKRNEPMKFFFRITDINKVAERFDYFDGRVSPEVVHPKQSTKVKRKDASHEKKPVKQEKKEEKKEDSAKVEKKEDSAKAEKSDVILKPEITEEIKNKIQSDIKGSVYTNITLNREDNVEIITKIQKVSNKEGQPIGLNIINHTVKKNKVQSNNKSDSKVVPSSSNEDPKPKTEDPKDDKDKEKEEIEKSNFLKNIELTAKSALEKDKKERPSVPPPLPSSSSSSSSQKRKNSSPMKNDKKPKIEKKPMKIIIQPKTIQNPTVRQMVTNVNQNANNMSKIVEQTTTKTDLQSLIDNCKINIPASLSITLNEGGEGGARTPPSIPPVKNYIEILKLPDKESTNEKKQEKTLQNPTKGVIKDKNRNIQTFQKIFEESIVKKVEGSASPTKGAKSTPLDLTSTNEPTPNNNNNKRKILEIASQLQKKTKIEQEKQKEEGLNKISIPKLATQRTLKPPSTKHEYGQNRPQNSASLHSSSLGLNYTVSVNQSKNGDTKGQDSKRLTPSTSKSVAKSKNSTNGAVSAPKGLTPNQLLETYNIQSMAQLTASLNFNAAGYGALQHAMLRHSWLNQGPLLQFEKYMQSLSAAQSKLMGNIKEN